MRAFWVSIALLLVAAVIWLTVGRDTGGPARSTASPAPDRAAAPSPGATKTGTESAPSKQASPLPAEGVSAKALGISQPTVEAAFKKEFPHVAFAPSNQSDGRRRVLGTLGQGRVPALELVGDENDLSQITAVGAAKTDDGPATAERAPFAVAVLDLVAPDWSDRKDWLNSALKAAAASETNVTRDHTLGRLNVHFASWRSLGVYRLTVETVEAAAISAASAARIETPAPATRAASETSAARPPDAGAPATTTEIPVSGESPAPLADVKLETKPDGTTVVDGKYVLKGSGTKEDPYQLTWDQLVSIQDDYVPRDGRKEIPGRAMMLNDKWVEITGYIAFPLMVDAPDECLSMMNQWDGCCIGVPPTPYDAVEVRLTEPVSGNARMATFGTVRGKFKVDPHLVGGWLVGLFVMDQTTLTPQTYGGFSP